MSRNSLWPIVMIVVVLFLSATGQATPVPGDINGDGTVDFSDFLILAQNFGKSGDPFRPDSGTETDTLSIESLNQQGFPLAVGNIWKYQATYLENTTDTLAVQHLAVQHFSVEWEVEAQEEVFGVTAFRIKTTHSISGDYIPESGVYTSLTWIAGTPDTLKAVASQGVPPFSEGQLSKPATLTLANDLHPWQFYILVFPLVPGKSWSVFDNSDFGRKTVIEKETISVPAGSFETYSVKYALEGSPEMTYVVWYGEVGIIKIANIVSGPSSSTPRVHHSVRVYELVSYRVD